MRPLLAALLAFVASAAVAHADTIDDFVLTAPGLSISFSHSAIYTFPDQPHLVALPVLSLTGTVNGVPGNSILATFYTEETFSPSLGLTYQSTPGSPATQDLLLYGPPVITPGPQTGTPGHLFDSGIFEPGTYDMIRVSFDPSPLYVLTITPETAPLPTIPEPATLSLLATGTLGVLGLLGRRRRR